MDAALFSQFLRRTQIVRTPSRALATFGATRINYHLISPVEELPNKTRLREGEVVSERPKILTAEAFAERFQGFGEEAKEFADWISTRYRDVLRSLEYNFKNQGFTARVISESPATVLSRITSDIDARSARDKAVITCPDGAWSLALMKFTLDESTKSFPTHVRDLERRGLFDPAQKDRDRRRSEIETLFSRAAQDRSVLQTLGEKLNEYGLFEEFEDRYLGFFSASPKKEP